MFGTGEEVAERRADGGDEHPNENVPEVSAAIVQTLQKKLIKDQTYKKRKAKRKKRKV